MERDEKKDRKHIGKKMDGKNDHQKKKVKKERKIS